MKRTITICAGLALFLLFFNGIGRHDVKEENYLALAKQKQFDCVVQVLRDTNPIGSGVLISDRHLLTAAHIIIASETREDTIVRNGMTLVTYQPYNIHADTSGLNIVVNGKQYKAKNMTMHPAYADGFTSSSHDLLIIEFEKSIKGITPAILNKKLDELGSIATGCGFGASGPADKPEEVGLFHKKIAGENTIDSLGGEKVNGQHAQLFADFDHPTLNDCNLMGSSKPLPLEYTVSGGDSGGGLFRKTKGKWELIGICSGSTVDIVKLLKVGYYGQSMNWVRVSVFERWIRESM